MDKQSISENNLLFLVTGFIIGTSLLLVPSDVIMDARQDAWLALLLGAIPSIFLIILLVSLQRMFPGQSLIQYSVSVLGYPIGKVIGGLFLWFAFHLTVLVLRNAIDFISILLPKTPSVILSAIIIFIIAYAVRSGIEVMTRVIIILLPIVLTIYIFISFLTLLLVSDFGRILPFLENGYLPLVKGMIGVASFPFGELVLFAIILSQCQDTKKTKRFAIFGIMIGVLALEFAIIRCITVLGVESTIKQNFPIVATISEITSGAFLMPFLTLVRFSFIFTKITICYYAFTSGLAYWLGIKDYRNIVTPTGVIMVAMSILIYPNFVEEKYFAAKIWPYYAIPFEYGIPLMLWLVAKIRYPKIT